MNEVFVVFSFLTILGGGRGSTENLFTRDGQASNKRPRDVETVAKGLYLRRGPVDPALDIPRPDVEETVQANLFDMSPPNTRSSTHGITGNARLSLWSDWSPCSRTCGGGIAFRTRHCAATMGFSKTDHSDQCGGQETEHKLCYTEECPPGSEDYLEMQCSQQNGKLFHERNFKWIPFFGKEGNTCELTCMTSNYMFYNVFGVLHDGTKCGAQRKGICVKGECVKIGCDGVLSSNATEDACGVCGGNNSTCRKFESVISRLPAGDITVGYKLIASVPIGATHIRAKDYNENFLALMEVAGSSEEYILNGNWVVEWTRQFQAAGSIGTYERNKAEDDETLHIIGPTEKELKIMMLIIDKKQPYVEFEYWIPRNESQEGDEFTAELKRPMVEVFRLETEDDLMDQILAAGLDPHAVVVPTAANTTTVPPTAPPAVTTNTSPPRRKPAKSYKKSRKSNASCMACRRGLNRKKQFCDNDFAFHVRVLSRRPAMRRSYARYTVEILHSYRSNVKVLRREYMWVSRTCCPRLRPYKHYLLMGRAAKVASNAVVTDAKRKIYKSPFVVNQITYWYSWFKQHYKMSRMTRRLNCRRYKYYMARIHRRRAMRTQR